MKSLLLIFFAVIAGRLSARVDVIAHRGFSGNAPENTLSAFRLARGLAEYVEFDVRTTSDGTLVLMHDDTVDRTTNGRGRVEALSVEYIRTLDAGGWWGPAYIGERVPLFSEAITAISPYARPMVERKSGTAQQYVSELRRLNAVERVVVYATTPSNLAFLRELKRLEPRIELGFTPTTISTDASDIVTEELLRECKDVGIRSIHLQWSAVNEIVAERVHRFGFRLLVWTVNSPGVLAQLPGLAVQAILTDFPDRARAVIGPNPLSVAPDLPLLSVRVSGGGTLALRAHVVDPVRTAMQWRQNQSLTRIGTTKVNYVATNVTDLDFGFYVATPAAEVSLTHFQWAVEAQSRSGDLSNLSSRQFAGAESAGEPAIAGFVAAGGGPAEFLIRVIGPGMSGFGVLDAIRTPKMGVYDSVGRPVPILNGDRSRVPEITQQVGAFALQQNSGDLAEVARLAPGAYTAVATGGSNDSGSLLIECYKVPDPSSNSRLINIATRANVGSGRSIIAGFVIGGDNHATVMIRGVGPTLGSFGIKKFLADPLLKLFDGTGRLIAISDDWSDEVDDVILERINNKVSAFSLLGGTGDAVLIMSLPPGNYTAQLAGNYNTSGVGLLEVYDVDARRELN